MFFSNFKCSLLGGKKIHVSPLELCTFVLERLYFHPDLARGGPAQVQWDIGLLSPVQGRPRQAGESKMAAASKPGSL